MTDKNDGVLAVLNRMAEQAKGCRRDGAGAGTQMFEDEAALAKVAELLAAAEALEHGVSAEKLIRLSDAIRAMRGDAT